MLVTGRNRNFLAPRVKRKKKEEKKTIYLKIYEEREESKKKKKEMKTIERPCSLAIAFFLFFIFLYDVDTWKRSYKISWILSRSHICKHGHTYICHTYEVEINMYDLSIKWAYGGLWGIKKVDKKWGKEYRMWKIRKEQKKTKQYEVDMYQEVGQRVTTLIINFSWKKAISLSFSCTITDPIITGR